MPRPPIFESERAQHVAIALTMAGVLAAAALVAWGVSGAGLGNPFASPTAAVPAQPEPPR